MSPKSCENCAHGATKDFGYSNYTVEETLWVCLKRCHPTLKAESFSDGVSYSSYEDSYAKDFEFAEECPQYEEGNNAAYDCDGEIEHPEGWE